MKVYGLVFLAFFLTAAGEKPVDKPVSAPTVTEARKSEAGLVNCHSYLATPMDSALLSYPNKIYFTSPKPPADKGTASHYLIEVDLSEGKAKRLAGFKSGKAVSLIAHDKTPKTISMLDFSSGRPDCGEGTTAGLAIRWKEQKVSASFPPGNYGIVPGELSATLADLDKGAVHAIDFVTGQKRTLETFRKGTRPLYLKAAPPTVIYAFDPQTKELSQYIASKKKPTSKLKLKEGMRLVRDADQFGVLTGDGNKLKVAEIPGWSSKKISTLDLELPGGFAWPHISMEARFATNEFLVFGSDEFKRKTQSSVVYFEDKRSVVFKAPDAKSYFSQAKFIASGAVVLLLSDIETDVVRELWLSVKGAEPKKIEVLKQAKVESPASAPK